MLTGTCFHPAAARVLLIGLLFITGCSDGETDQPGDATGARTPVELNPEQAQLEGSAQYKCWSGRCYWVVWCGHNICDGSWSWSFAGSGAYEIIWQGVSYKCAGAPPYELRINGEAVLSDRLSQYGSCDRCAPDSLEEVFRDTSLGTHRLEEGDEIALHITNDFACGIEGPGAYAAFKTLVAEPRD